MEDEVVYTDIINDQIPAGWEGLYTLMLVEPLARINLGDKPKRRTNQVATDRTGEFTQACARYANERLRALGYDVLGSAWNRTGNASKVLSGFDYNEEARPTAFNKASVNAHNRDAATHFLKHFNPYNVLENDIVSFYYNNSPATEEAYYDGIDGVSSTHTGNIVMVNGVPYVEHNIHGDVFREPLESTLGNNKLWGVTGIWRPEPRPVRFTKPTKHQWQSKEKTEKRSNYVEK